MINLEVVLADKADRDRAVILVVIVDPVTRVLRYHFQ